MAIGVPVLERCFSGAVRSKWAAQFLSCSWRDSIAKRRSFGSAEVRFAQDDSAFFGTCFSDRTLELRDAQHVSIGVFEPGDLSAAGRCPDAK